MLDLIIKLLTPLAQSLGASASDVSTYVNMVGGYIYGLLGVTAALIVVLICARFMKGNRPLIRWGSVVSWILIVTLLANLMCYGPLYNVLNQFLNAKPVEISEDVALNSWNVADKVGDEGMVLLKNDGLLPLGSDTTKLNVFGWASVNPVYSGTGSAAAGEAAVSRVTLLQSLESAGYALNGELSKLYADYRSARPAIKMNSQDWTLPEPTKAAYTTTLLNGAKDFSDVALIVIGRSGGENADLPADMNSVINGSYNLSNGKAIYKDSKYLYGYTAGVYTNNGDYDDFEPGEHYLELSRTEEDLVETVCSVFDKVVVIINANNAMELGWVENYPAIKAVILAPGTGDAGMGALGRILNGTVNPSGKTVDTYVYDLTATPTWNHSGNSGNHLLSKAVNPLLKALAKADMSFQGAVSFVDYVENIYMGYKFYETAAEEGLIRYEDTVQYPFGYGLSYTSFSQRITDFRQDADSVTLSVEVKNTGSAAGKDVVELYFTPPYTNGGIEKASVNLVDFAKTELLEPGASQTLSFTVALESLASYDSSCVKTAAGGYVLESGEYVLSVRADSHTVLDSHVFSVEADLLYTDSGRSDDQLTPVNRFGYAEGEAVYLSRRDGFANYESAVAAPDESRFTLSEDMKAAIEAVSAAGYDPKAHDDPADLMPALGENNGLKLADMTGMPYDDPQWESFLNQLTLEDMTTLINTGGWQTAAIESIGKVKTSDADGPTGLSVYLTGDMGTCFPAVPMMAQSWNKEIAELVGEAIGQEFAVANNYGWYGPAMNLHRSAFSGRNYEYYSEDGVLSGLLASREVNGAAKYGVYSYLKHFAANDQETNRCAFLQTYMTEQTLRENVLRPFELVVKAFPSESRALAMMSAYNWLGTVPVISNYDLLTTVLRDEWGFCGMVISDYNGSYGYQISDAAVRAGNDLMLGQGVQESNQFTDTDSATCVLAMRQACKNILYTIANSGYYAAGATEEGGSNSMNRLFVTVDALIAALCVLVMTAVLFRGKKRKGGEA